MAYNFLSPEVRVEELDFSGVITPSSVGVGAFVGTFQWGPVEVPKVVTSESNLATIFGKPSDDNYVDFVTAAQFLGYSNHLKVCRVVADDAAANAMSGGNGTGLTLDVNVLNGKVSSVAINQPGFMYEPGDVVFITGAHIENAKAMVTDVTSGGAVTAVKLMTQGDGYDASATNVATEALNRVLVKNETHFEGQTHMPQWVAKYPGSIGNSIGVGIVNASHFYGWEFADRFITPPDADIVAWDGTGHTNEFKTKYRDDSGNYAPLPHISGGYDASVVVDKFIIDGGAGYGEWTASYDPATGETTITINVATETFNGDDSTYEFALANVAAFPYEFASVVDINGTKLAEFTDYEEEFVPKGSFAIRNGKLVIGTEVATFSGTGYTSTFTIVGVTGITDARVWVDGVEKTVVSAAPANANEVQVTDNGSNTDIVFHSTGIPAAGISNIVVRWDIPDAGAVITCTYGYPRKDNDNVKAIFNQTGVHVVVYDAGAKWTGIKDYTLEAFQNLSLVRGSVGADNLNNFFRDVINSKSTLVWASEDNVYDDYAQGPVVFFGNHILSRGADGISAVVDADYIRGWELFKNKEEYDVTHLIAGARSVAVRKYVIENVAEFRNDAIAWIAPPREAVVNNPIDPLIKVLEDRKLFNSSSYAAYVGNWKKVYGYHLDKKVWVPCDADGAGIYSRATNNFYPWVPGAGYNRGHVINALELAWSPNKAQRDELYVSPHNINPIFHDNYDGDVLFGNKTMQAKESAFDRINTRLLFIVIEKSITKAAKYFLFEVNTPFTRTRFRHMIIPFLRDIKALDGLEDYRVICDERNNPPAVRARHELQAFVMIKPTYSIEWITMKFAAVGPDLSFEYVIGEMVS